MPASASCNAFAESPDRRENFRLSVTVARIETTSIVTIIADRTTKTMLPSSSRARVRMRGPLSIIAQCSRRHERDVGCVLLVVEIDLHRHGPRLLVVGDGTARAELIPKGVVEREQGLSRRVVDTAEHRLARGRRRRDARGVVV